MDGNEDPSLTNIVCRTPHNLRLPKQSSATSFQVFVFLMLVMAVMMVMLVMAVMLVTLVMVITAMMVMMLIMVMAVIMIISDVAGS